jgi:hypothetical protein
MHRRGIIDLVVTVLVEAMARGRVDRFIDRVPGGPFRGVERRGIDDREGIDLVRDLDAVERQLAVTGHCKASTGVTLRIIRKQDVNVILAQPIRADVLQRDSRREGDAMKPRAEGIGLKVERFSVFGIDGHRPHALVKVWVKYILYFPRQAPKIQTVLFGGHEHPLARSGHRCENHDADREGDMFFMAAALSVALATAGKPTGGNCEKLMRQYEGVSMEISAIEAQGLGDDSAPRELVRQQKTAAQMTKGQILVALMQAAKCQLPELAPDSYYIIPATQCETDRLRETSSGSDADAEKSKKDCNRDFWEPIVPDLLK